LDTPPSPNPSLRGRGVRERHRGVKKNKGKSYPQITQIGADYLRGFIRGKREEENIRRLLGLRREEEKIFLSVDY